MKNLATSARLALTSVALVGSIGFLLILEFGISAGRVHHGVTVGGEHVGGLTLNELQDSLIEKSEGLGAEDACFSYDAIRLCIDPAEVRWHVAPRETAQEAFDIGRTNFPLEALNERARAWVLGFDVSWRGTTRGKKVGAVLNQWESIFAERKLELRRFAARKRIHRALATYPRDIVPIPIHQPAR